MTGSMSKGSTMTLYGFKGCDMVRNAMKWLDANELSYRFFDYRRESLDSNVVDDWCARVGWEKVFNRNSTTFKELPERDQNGIDERRAKQMMLAETNLIKRPVLDAGDLLLLGFKATTWADALASRVAATR